MQRSLETRRVRWWLVESIDSINKSRLNKMFRARENCIILFIELKVILLSTLEVFFQFSPPIFLDGQSISASADLS